MEYLFYYMPPTPNKIWEDKGKENTSQQKFFFFVKIELEYI